MRGGIACVELEGVRDGEFFEEPEDSLGLGVTEMVECGSIVCHVDCQRFNMMVRSRMK